MQPLTRFVLPEDEDIYWLHRKPLFETGAPQVCELRMLRKDGSQFWARLEETAAQEADGASGVSHRAERHHGAQAVGGRKGEAAGAGQSGPEDGNGRKACRRGGARPEQPADPDPWAMESCSWATSVPTTRAESPWKRSCARQSGPATWSANC